MKGSTIALLSLFSILLFPVSWATTTLASVQDNFIQCLDNALPVQPHIYIPNNPLFASVLQSHKRNLRFDTPTTPKPFVIVTATNESHVQATVVCAKKLGIELRLRSGGHDYEGVSYVSQVPFVILDMFNLRSIDIDIENESAWVQAGATLGEIYYAIAHESKNHAFAAGVCPDLGAGGHIGGGGYGNLLRQYGVATDNVLDAQIVDAKGRILDRKSMGEDLFWAIRGGGAGSFGVILSWKIKLVRVPDTVTVFRVSRTLDQGATDIVSDWEQVVDKLPKSLFIRVWLKTVNGTYEPERTIQASFIGMFLGESKRLVQLMHKRLPKLGLQQKEAIEMSWLESVVFWADKPLGTPVEVLLGRATKPGIFLKRKSDYVVEPISKTGLEAIWSTMIELEDVMMLWNPYGGMMSNISATETAFPHRAGNIFKIQYSTNWMEEGIEAANLYLNKTRKLFEAMTPYVSKNPRKAFLNYRDLDIGTSSNGNYEEAKVYGIKYFEGNFDRLVRVKTMVDPDNFFRNEQSIPTLPSRKP
uniref:FAD-binding PCMH-type domain-containing protein n=1 Tax=Fagus sylvatica TaxID=28930 RepID=A0A2N9G8I5_FAGSY